jgi:hypothetical protein
LRIRSRADARADPLPPLASSAHQSSCICCVLTAPACACMHYRMARPSVAGSLYDVLVASKSCPVHSINQPAGPGSVQSSDRSGRASERARRRRTAGHLAAPRAGRPDPCRPHACESPASPSDHQSTHPSIHPSIGYDMIDGTRRARARRPPFCAGMIRDL